MNATKSPFKIFLAYIMGEKKLFIIDTICAVLVAAIDLAFPYVSKSSMQTYLPQSLYRTFSSSWRYLRWRTCSRRRCTTS